MKKLSAVLTRSKRKILEYKDATETTSSQLEQMRHLEELSKPLIPDNYTMTSGCLSESIDEQTQKQLQLDAWVQCENPDCLKWRRLSQEAAAQLNGDSPWFCFLNQDPNYCSCDDPEEDYRQLEHMAKKLGLKYVASTLQEGTLVWAKMAGYCRWPAIITRDPYDGLHVMEASGGDPQSYHVEFLGQPHSHGWVASRMVDLYGSVDKQSPTKIRMTRSFGRIGTGRKTNVWKPKERTVYKSVTIATAEAEAAQFVDITPLERLASSVFKYVEQSQSQKDSEEVLLDHKEYPNEKARSKQDTHQKKRIKGTVSIKKVEIEDSQTQRLLSPKQGDVYDFSNQGSPMNRLEMKSRLKCSTPLAGKTKEQKFALDIEMYRRNAKAFEHDVQRFMARSGTRIHRMPCWQNTPVSLFQIFLAVHERGGFQNVGRHRGGWAGVYQEVTSISNACYGNVAKNYYMVNLLPYEMYLAGEDYSLYIHGRKRKKIKLQNSNDAEREINQNNVEYVNLQLKQQMQSELDGEDMSSQSDDHKEESSMELRGSEIEQLLHKLDTCGDQCTLNDVDQTAEDARPDIEVTFYDESPNQKKICLKEADTASEFGQADMPEGAIQEVPDVIYTSDEEPEEDEDEQVLHEMQALQEELDEMNQEVAQDWTQLDDQQNTRRLALSCRTPADCPTVSGCGAYFTSTSGLKLEPCQLNSDCKMGLVRETSFPHQEATSSYAGTKLQYCQCLDLKPVMDQSKLENCGNSSVPMTNYLSGILWSPSKVTKPFPGLRSSPVSTREQIQLVDLNEIWHMIKVETCDCLGTVLPLSDFDYFGSPYCLENKSVATPVEDSGAQPLNVNKTLNSSITVYTSL